MDMEELDSSVKKLEAILQKREPFRPSEAAHPVSTNRYRMRGELSKAKKSFGIKKHKGSSNREPDNERALQPLFEQEPSLLFTPNLLSGGLFADSIFSQVPLPSGRKPDFAYLSTEANRVKITLVEIESSRRQVFLRGWNAASKFYHRCEDGINQVRQWVADLRASHARTTLLSTFNQVLASYPYPVFDQYGEVSPAIDLSIDYVLIIGEDRPTMPEHWTLIDKLYREEGIILLTYPMLIDAVKKKPAMRNMLRLSCKKGIVVQTAHAPVSLMGVLPVNGGGERQISLGALGFGSPFLSRGSTCFTNSTMAKRIVYRSGGKCEHPGCSSALDQKTGKGLYFGLLFRIVTDDFLPEDLVDWRHVGLFCEEHAVSAAYDPNTDHLYWPGRDVHPLQDAFRMTGKYRVELDIASSTLINQHRESLHRDKCESLGLNPAIHRGLFDETCRYLQLLSSLPPRVRISLARVATMNTINGFRNVDVADLHFEILRRFGLVRIAEGKGGAVLLADSLPYGLFEYLVRVHGDERASRIVWDMCTGNLGIKPKPAKSKGLLGSA